MVFGGSRFGGGGVEIECESGIVVEKKTNRNQKSDDCRTQDGERSRNNGSQACRMKEEKKKKKKKRGTQDDSVGNASQPDVQPRPGCHCLHHAPAIDEPSGPGSLIKIDYL